MKKVFVFIVLAVSAMSFSAHAANADCPLKNLKKNQLRSADGTAYFPAAQSSRSADSASRVHKNN